VNVHRTSQARALRLGRNLMPVLMPTQANTLGWANRLAYRSYIKKNHYPRPVTFGTNLDSTLTFAASPTLYHAVTGQGNEARRPPPWPVKGLGKEPTIRM